MAPWSQMLSTSHVRERRERPNVGGQTPGISLAELGGTGTRGDRPRGYRNRHTGDMAPWSQMLSTSHVRERRERPNVRGQTPGGAEAGRNVSGQTPPTRKVRQGKSRDSAFDNVHATGSAPHDRCLIDQSERSEDGARPRESNRSFAPR